MCKKILAFMLVAAMSVSLLAGCGDNNNNNDAQTTPTTAPVSGDSQGSGAFEDSGLWSDYQVDLTNRLSNPNASDKAIATYNWLLSIQGQYIISGQQEKVSDSTNEEFTYINSYAEVLPGLRGLDFINGDYEGVVRRSITWDKFNCLISICWHMGTPGNVDGGYNVSQETYEGLAEALDDPESEGYKQIVADMDVAAEYLKQLQDEGIVVLWRPFHEFDGKWFWWGKAGSESFVKLWRLMYDRYTNYHGLNNLIWVLGYTGNSQPGSVAWYPGDEYVDIIGADSYGDSAADDGYGGMYSKLVEGLADSGKPTALHECGKMPKVSALQENDIEWLWFLVWHTNYINNESVNSVAHLVSTYTSDYVLTMDEMPDFDELLAK